jgi:hypothetical protein
VIRVLTLAIAGVVAGACHRARPELPVLDVGMPEQVVPKPNPTSSADVVVTGPAVWTGAGLEVPLAEGWRGVPFRGGFRLEGPSGVRVEIRQGGALRATDCQGPPHSSDAQRVDAPWVGAGQFRTCWPSVADGSVRWRWTSADAAREIEVEAPAGTSVLAWDTALPIVHGVRTLRDDDGEPARRPTEK